MLLNSLCYLLRSSNFYKLAVGHEKLHANLLADWGGWGCFLSWINEYVNNINCRSEEEWKSDYGEILPYVNKIGDWYDKWEQNQKYTPKEISFIRQFLEGNADVLDLAQIIVDNQKHPQQSSNKKPETHKPVSHKK